MSSTDPHGLTRKMAEYIIKINIIQKGRKGGGSIEDKKLNYK